MGLDGFLSLRNQDLATSNDQTIGELREKLNNNLKNKVVDPASFKDVQSFMMLAKDDADLDLSLSSFKL
jgi:hypothetical protein